MIEINSIEDLKPYVKYVPSKYINGCNSYVSVNMVKEGKLEDVTINCNLDLTFSLDNVYNNVFDIEKEIAEDTMSQYCELRLVAHNIYIKKEFICNYVECENFYFDENVSLNFLVADGEVKGKSISSKDIMCSSLEADYVYSRAVNLVKLKAKNFYGKDVVFTNVSYHQPEFNEDLIKNWNGVKIKKFDFIDDLDFPF